jgi:hypothetical protein
MRRCTIGPATSRLGEGLAGRDFLVPSCSSDSLWRAGSLQADHGCRLDGVATDTLVHLASGLSEHCVKKQCGLAGSSFRGRMALNLRHSQVRMGVSGVKYKTKAYHSSTSSTTTTSTRDVWSVRNKIE